MSLGVVFALIGAAIAVGASGIGSAIGVQRAGQAASGLLTKEPKGFGKLLLLMVLPSSQCIYGFVVSIIIFVQLGMVGGVGAPVTNATGLSMMFLSLPVGIVGLISAIMQGNAAVSAINLLGKQPKLFGNSIVIVTLVEMFALFGFLISLLGILFTPVQLITEVPVVTESIVAGLMPTLPPVM